VQNNIQLGPQVKHQPTGSVVVPASGGQGGDELELLQPQPVRNASMGLGAASVDGQQAQLSTIKTAEAKMYKDQHHRSHQAQ